MTTYLVKCQWASTALTLQVPAKSPAEALSKAAKHKNTRTALNFKIVGQR